MRNVDESRIFSCLHNLWRSDLRGIKLKYIITQAFERLNKLTDRDLINAAKDIAIGAFDELDKLKTLCVHDTQIGDIKNEPFSGM